MQPYFFPYIGYFQLMRAADVFVSYDDVQYINRGWVNRNLISLGQHSHWLTMPVAQASRDLEIRHRRYWLENDSVAGVKRKLVAAYKNAPAFREVFPIVEEALASPDDQVAAFNTRLLAILASQLGLACKIILSSDLPKAPGLRGQDKVLEICSHLGATRYINPIGGRSLYAASNFAARGIELSFIQSRTPPTMLADVPHHLSIIHHLMTFGVAGTVRLLDDFDQIPPEP